MKYAKPLIVFFLFASITSCEKTDFILKKTTKTVYIVLDGIPADIIEKVNTPNIDAIASEGGFAQEKIGGEKGEYTESPTISAVGYNCILTGTWAVKHNVWDNTMQDPNYHYKNIFRLLKESNPEKTIGIFSSWEDNRTKLVGEGLSEAGNIFFDYHFDGLEFDTENYPHDPKKDYMRRIDSAVTDAAAETIKNNAPDLSWVYLEYTDDIGHLYGDGPKFNRAVMGADEFVGKIWDALKYREKNFNEDWLIIVTTDHGRFANGGYNHGGQSARERTGWISTNAKNLNDRFTNSHATIVDIMPTIARFMNIDIPLKSLREIDGVPLIGELSLTHPTVQLNHNNALIQWHAKAQTGKVKIYMATTNHFKNGGKDEYTLMEQVPVKDGQVSINLKNIQSSFYKFYLEGIDNGCNHWYFRE